MNINLSTTQKSIKISGVFEKYGLIETKKHHYVKIFRLGDNNYLTAMEEEQVQIYEGYRKVLNSFGSNIDFAITIFNRAINENAVSEDVLIKEVGDEWDYLRKQMNNIILDRIKEGKNGIIKDKYLSVSVEAKSVKKAFDEFSRISNDLNKSFEKIGSFAIPLTLPEEIEILYDIYSDDDTYLVQTHKTIDDKGQVIDKKTFDFENMRSLGLTINDLLAPSSITYEPKYMMLGNKYARTLRVSQLPSRISDEFLTNVTDMNFSLLTTINIHPMSVKQADALVAKNLSFIRDEKKRALQAGQKAGIYDDSYVDPKILDREAEALALRDAMHSRDEHLFETSLTVTIFADNKEQLDEYTETIITEYKKAAATINVMVNQQEEGFNSTLPLCNSEIREKRTLTTSSSAIFIPFSTLELNDKSGINYSCNLISKNLIVYDRMSSNNFNGFVLGSPGSGKSFISKVEMLSVFLKTNADIIVIDPEDEYTALATMLGGEVIKIMPDGRSHINPLEIVNAYELEDETNPVNAKADFILKVMECILASPFGIDSIQQTIIDECVQELFEPFVLNGKLREIPEKDMPTLTDLQYLLAKRREPEARNLAMALKLYTGKGSLNTFGFQTNVKTRSRFVVYQIRDIGDRLKSLAMLTILDHIWNRIVLNRKVGKNTWFFVDEIYLLFQNEYSATFLNTLFRRARKYGGVPTGITQNVSSLLESPTARDMLQNCCYLAILSQSGPDRDRLREILNLSDTQISYITNAPRGQGLLYTGSNLVPFYSRFPKGNDIYRALTSDLKEIKAFEEMEKRQEIRAKKEMKNVI